jgi:hypothetical protein
MCLFLSGTSTGLSRNTKHPLSVVVDLRNFVFSIVSITDVNYQAPILDRLRGLVSHSLFRMRLN